VSTRDYRIDSSTPNERIAAVIAGMREVAMHDLGFKRSGTRADGEIELTQTGARIRYEARFISGEGRIVLYITKPGLKLRTREIQIRGREVVSAELERCRKELLNIVRRVTAVKP
jgi:hypothetical protein